MEIATKKRSGQKQLDRRERIETYPADTSSKDLKSYLTQLERARLIVLASKYKVKICKSGRKQQIIDTFANRVPSNMIELICVELEKQAALPRLQPRGSKQGTLAK